jgi:hypothetical protein
MGVERLAASLTRLQDALADVRLPLDVPDAEQNRDLVRAQSRQIEDYVLPRLRRLDAPLLTVVGGSTGAGKSTLVNSLMGRVVTATGVIRPTTRSSVLVHHPDDARWFESSQILPGLARSDASVTDPRVLQLVPEPSLPKGLAILDAPDVDSVVAQNRTLAAQLLAAADLWLFVTSAARYADAVPWQYLRAAARRKAVVAVVLDRVPPAAMLDVPPHLGQMMSQRGLSASPLFAVPETSVDADGLLPDAAVAPIRGWLAELAEDTVRRNQVVLQTLDGAIESLSTLTPELVVAVDAQLEALDTLRADAEKSFAEAARSVAAQTADGTLLRGEVLARWQDFVGTGEFFRAVEKRIGLFRDRLVQAAKGEPKQAQDVQLAVESGLEVLIREEGEFAARRVVSAWEAHPAGRQLLDRDGALGQVSSDFSESAARVIRNWQGDVLELVSAEGKSKKATARYLALGVNGAGVALMIFVFSQTGGLVGAEVGVAGGTAVLAQRVLEAVFGEDAVRRLAKEAKRQLDARVEALMAAELARFEKLVDEVEVRAEQAEQLKVAIAALDIERADAERYVREAALTSAVSAVEPIGPGEADPAVDDVHAIGDAPAVATADAADDLGSAAGPDEVAEAVDGAAAPEVTEAPQRFVEGDTGLLPSLVSAQLSALAADASKRGDDEPEPAGDDAVVVLTDEDDIVGGESDDAVGEPDGVGGDRGDAGAVTDTSGFASAEESEDSEELSEADEGAVEVEPVDLDEVAGGSPDAEGDQPQQGTADDSEVPAGLVERAIPVPAGLAELAAEAVRRPDEPRDDAQEPAPGAESAPLGAETEASVERGEGADVRDESANADEPAGPDAEPVDSTEEGAPGNEGAPTDDNAENGHADAESNDDGQIGEESSAAALQRESEAVTQDADSEGVEATENPDAVVEAPAEDGLAPVAFALPTPPLLPAAPMPFFAPAAESEAELPGGEEPPVAEPDLSSGSALPSEPIPALPTAPPLSAAAEAIDSDQEPQAVVPEDVDLPVTLALPAAPMPVPSGGVRYYSDPESVPAVLLVPPDQIPAAPPVPRWPEPDEDVVPESSEEDQS